MNAKLSQAKQQAIESMGRQGGCILRGSRNSFTAVKFNFLNFSIKLCNLKKRE